MSEIELQFISDITGTCAFFIAVVVVATLIFLAVRRSCRFDDLSIQVGELERLLRDMEEDDDVDMTYDYFRRLYCIHSKLKSLQ